MNFKTLKDLNANKTQNTSNYCCLVEIICSRGENKSTLLKVEFANRLLINAGLGLDHTLY